VAVIGASQRSLSAIAPIGTEHSSVFQARDAVSRVARLVSWWWTIETGMSRMMSRRIFAGFARAATRGWAFAPNAWAWGVGHVSLIRELKRSGSTLRRRYRTDVASAMKAGGLSTKPRRSVVRNSPRKSGGAGAVGALDPRCLCVLTCCSFRRRTVRYVHQILRNTRRFSRRRWLG
jgi:hypothetical protein